jgi:GT2 family glycosyltransferase
MGDPRCTIVVASRDRHAELRASIARHRALPERPRVIVVDDASARPIDAPDSDVIRLPTSLGGAARTVGARASTSPYLAFTDDDAWWEPGALCRAADLLDAHPTLAVVQAHVLVGPVEKDDPTCAQMRNSPLEPHHDQPGHPILSFIACAVVVRHVAFLACGGFHPSFGTGGEEELLSWDLVAAGWQLSYVPDVIAYHHPPPAVDGRPARRTTIIRNALWTQWLRRPLPAAARATAATLRAALHDRTTARACASAFAGSGWVLRERHVNPPHVEAMCRRLAR